MRTTEQLRKMSNEELEVCLATNNAILNQMVGWLYRMIVEGDNERIREILHERVTMKVGDRGFTISPSTESAAYGDMKPREPWYCQIDQIWDRDIKVVTVMSNGVLDYDTNASAIIPKDQFYKTQEAAEAAYKDQLATYYDGLLDEVPTEFICNYIKRALEALWKLDNLQ